MKAIEHIKTAKRLLDAVSDRIRKKNPNLSEAEILELAGKSLVAIIDKKIMESHNKFNDGVREEWKVKFQQIKTE